MKNSYHCENWFRFPWCDLWCEQLNSCKVVGKNSGQCPSPHSSNWEAHYRISIERNRNVQKWLFVYQFPSWFIPSIGGIMEWNYWTICRFDFKIAHLVNQTNEAVAMDLIHRNIFGWNANSSWLRLKRNTRMQ